MDLRRLRLALLLFLAVLPLLAAPGLPGVGRSGAASAQAGLDRLELVTASGRHAFRIEIAADDEKRAEGLMFRTKLDPDYGMLFDFKREQPVYFWMKNTYVSLDMIFIRADGTIAHIAENTTPLSEATVPSQASVRFVLEVVAGTSKRLGLKAGDKVVHPLMRG
ncbi:DUF192 domain-containing protein [Prosthecomicrobium sp. N25]|uniref:DUF192 domain-containing protein n=1 Tax=Prosthecomicrobium sp. N25 TaxID=3129254 RepID=UPI003078261E